MSYEQFSPLIIAEAKKQGVDPAWVLAIADQETGGTFDANLTSGSDAKGLMQLMPKTASAYGLDEKTVFDPQLNISAGVSELKQNLKLAKGNPELATVYYNRGYGNATNPNKPMPEETKKYVNSLFGEGNKVRKYTTLALNDTGNTMTDATSDIDYSKYADAPSDIDYSKYADEQVNAPQSQAVQPSADEIYPVTNTADVIASVGSGLAAPIAGGLAGLAGGVTDLFNPNVSGSGGNAERYQQATQKAFTYRPKGAIAQGVMEILGGVGQTIQSGANAGEGLAVQGAGNVIGMVDPEYGQQVAQVGEDIYNKGLGEALSAPFLQDGNSKTEAVIGSIIKGAPTAASMYVAPAESPALIKSVGTSAGTSAAKLLQKALGEDKLPQSQYTSQAGAPLTTAEVYSSPRLQGATEAQTAANPEFAARLQEVYQGTNKALLEPIMRHYEDQQITQGKIGQRGAEAEINYNVPKEAPDIDVADIHAQLKDVLKNASDVDDIKAVKSVIDNFERKSVPDEYIDTLTERLNSNISRIAKNPKAADNKLVYEKAIDSLNELKSGNLLPDGSINTPAKVARGLDGYISEIGQTAPKAVKAELRAIAQELRTGASTKYLKTGAREGSGINQAIRDVANSGSIKNKNVRAQLLKMSDTLTDRIGAVHAPYKDATKAYKDASRKIVQEDFFREMASNSVDVSNLVRGIDQKLNYHNVNLNNVMELASSATSDKAKLSKVIGEENAKYYSGLFDGENPLFSKNEAKYMNLAADINKSAKDASQISRVRDIGVSPARDAAESHLEKAATAGAVGASLATGYGLAGGKGVMLTKELAKAFKGKRGKEVQKLYENALISPEVAKKLMGMPQHSYMREMNRIIINNAKKGVAAGTRANAATTPLTIKITNFKDEDKK